MRRRVLLLIGVSAICVLGAGGTLLMLRRGDPLSQARFHMAHGDLRAAELVLDRYLRNHPESAEANFRLGIVSLTQNNGVAAEQRLKRARAQGYDMATLLLPLGEAYLKQQNRFDDVLSDFNPDKLPPAVRPEAMLVRAMAHLQARRLTEAQDAVTEAIHLKPGLTQAYVVGARVALARNDLPAVERMTDQALKLAPGNLDATLLKAELAMRRQDPARALDLGEIVRKGDPSRDDARMTVARALTALQRDREAAAMVEQVARHSPRAVDVNFLRLVLAVRTRDFATAEAATNALSGVIDDLPQGDYFLAVTKLGRDLPAQAEEAAAKHVARTPGDPMGRKLLAYAQLANGRPDAALATLKPIADGKPDADTLDLVARAKAMKGDITGARANLTRANQLDPTNPDVLNRLAATKLEMGEQQAAEADLRASLARLPNQPAAAQTLVGTMLARGDYGAAEAAVADLRKAVGDTELVGALAAEVKISKLDLKGAEAEFQDLLKRFPGSRTATFGLIQAEGRLGRANIAEQYLDAWMAKHPDDWQGLQLQMRTLSLAGRAKDAIAAAEAAHGANPRDLNVVQALTAMYMGDKQYDKAVGLLDRSGAATNPGLGLVRGAVLAVAGKRPEARRTLLATLSLAPDNLQVRSALLELVTGDGNWDEARRIARDGLRLQPGNERLLQALVAIDLKDGGLERALATIADLALDEPNKPAIDQLTQSAYFGARQFDKAAESALTSHRAEPSEGTLRLAVAALRAAKRDKEALGLLRDWAAGHPNDILSRQDLASDALQGHRMQEADRLLQEILAKQPANGVALNNMAWTRLDRNDLAGARDAAQRAYYLEPTAETEDTLGWVLSRQGELEQAQILLAQAAGAKPSSTILYHYAATLAAAGHAADAKAALARALAAKEAFDERAEAEALQKRLGG